MRLLIFLALIVLVLAMVGWITFNKGPDRPSVTIESDKIRQDTKQILGSGAQILHKAGDKVEAEADRAPAQAPYNPNAAPATR